MTEWRNVRLGDICEIVRGGSPRPIIDYITEDENGVNWFKIGDIKETDKFFTHAKERIKPEGITKSREVIKGDIILSNSMSFGRAFITLIDGYIHDGWLRLRCNEKVLNKEYLYYFLISNLAQNQFKAVATGSVVNNLKSETVKNVNIALPSIDLQEKIASLLSIIDCKIVVNDEINKNLLKQVRLFFEQIYSKGKLSKISDIVYEIESGSRPKGGAVNSGVPSIGAEKIECFGSYDYSSEKYIPEDYFLKLSRGIVQASDVLLYKDGAYTGKVSMALDDFPHARCAVNEHVFILRTEHHNYQYYLYCCLSRKEIKDMVFALASSKAAQPGLNKSEILGVEIKIPDNNILKQFEEFVDPLMHLIALNTKENKKLSDLRDELLPTLMSGELDVSEINF